jgi:restriction system protein
MSKAYYYLDISNPVTGEKLRVKAADRNSLGLKVQRQYERWERAQVREAKAEKKQIAFEKSEEARANITGLNNILKATLDIDDRIDWVSLLDRRPFADAEPMIEQFRQSSLSKSFSFIPALKRRSEEQSHAEEEAFKWSHKQYLDKKTEWENDQNKHNLSIKKQKIAYEKGEQAGIEAYVSMVLDRSSYPDVINVNSELAFDERTQTLLVELELPKKDNFQRVKEYKYIPGRDAIEEKLLTDKDFASLYDQARYQIMLRTLHEVFESDYKQFIKAIVLNGDSEIRDKGTGKASTKTIATIQVQREEFVAVDFSGVEPAACFRHFRGVTAGSLIELTPVKPIMKLNREDRRIIPAESIIDEFDPTQNLASMPWEEFEVLIRDLIQEEFSGEGTTVEVTQASHDAGVDAIAFDEDPIRGGKFVIQAKRYNNLVPVSAVRDLYGTVVNEGAVKGILVTTSYYGPDAVSFAKDKPLTLINGEQLLYMFHKHGHKFRIALKEHHAASSRLF